ncbi:MAG TPA: flagellar biosynthesis protein FlhF [Bacillota bacterium]
MRIKRYVAATMEEALQHVKAELGPAAIILEARRRRRALGLFGPGGVEVVAAVDPGLRLVSDRGAPAPGAAPATAPVTAPATARHRAGAVSYEVSLEPPAAPRTVAVRAYRQAASTAEGTDATGGTPSALAHAGWTQDPVDQPAVTRAAAAPAAVPSTRAPRPAPETTGVEEAAATPARAASAPVPSGVGSPRVPATGASRPGDPGGDLAALLRCDLMPQTAEQLLKDGVGTNDPRFAQRLEQLAAERLGAAPTAARTIAFIGPTGAGKTTTLAKLASRAVLVEGRRVALITLDTYRVGAVEQLQTYAEILDVPLFVAYTAEDLRQALDRAAHADLVLIDTAGRGPADAVGIARLRQALAQVQIDQIQLVMTAGTRVLDAQYLGATYRRLDPNRLLLTKLDETLALGGILEIPALLGLPVSYFTFGQSVPDDIEPATPQRAAARLLAVLRAGGEGAGA